ncbi:MAG TPA: hypothetical protein VFF75_04600 [Methylophilaceae bacterium]|nr:hypothetical protein [Methylophilaceae bacterium]
MRYLAGMKFLAKFLLLALSSISPAYAISSISIEIGHVESDAGEARNVAAEYALGASKSAATPIALKGQIKPAGDKQWSDLALSCDSLSNPKVCEWHCNNGKLASQLLSTPFDLVFTSNEVKGQQQMAAKISLKDTSFNDEAGLHAGEKVTGRISLKLSRVVKEPANWQWQVDIDWASGEIFWQPFYFSSGGHQFQASGSFGDKAISINKATLSLKDVGQATMSGLWLRDAKKFEDLTVQTSSLDLDALYPLVLKPLFEKTAYSNLEMAGRGSLRLDMQDGEYKSFQLALQDVDVEDKNGRFALYKVNAAIPWSYDDVHDLRLAYEGGHLLKIPLGKTNLAAQTNRYSLTTPQLKLPILDGALVVSDVSAAWVNRQWHWHLRANLEPFSMSDLSHALGWPRMEGKANATIPMVTYSNGYLTTDGALRFSVFDGDITVTNLSMRDPLGIGPRLTADMQLRNLDLGALTRTFSFGNIEGKLDGDVKDLQLVNWQPVHFDAEVRDSPGRYPKKISQRAVENISSLGGAGATAAIQRSFLRFFDQFNYSDIGLSCQLRGDVCEMAGVESTQQGYIIVKGSGIPAITVLGYNRRVSWNELLDRIKRVTSGNTKAIVR